MSKLKNIYIGLMSGTSLDGIDIVAARFEPSFQLLASQSAIIPAELKNKLLSLTQPGSNEIDLMGIADNALGQLFADATNQLIDDNNIDRSQIRAIGSHGQTIRHRPECGFTLQIGNANIIAEQTRITTVADFRRRDMATGGQGAPLVPAFHKALLQSSVDDRILLNVGGMANITFLPCNIDQPVMGFDTGPGNVLSDAWIMHCLKQPFDHHGDWARSGSLNSALLNDLLSLPYFSEAPPKSTGREQFNLDWVQQILAGHSTLSDADVQRTLLELTAESISSNIRQFVPSQQFELFVCGGGSNNRFMLERLRLLMPQIKISTSDKLGIEADWMEAAAFAWLAKRCLDGESGNVPDVTGASHERILGSIHPA
nr:anhydro-N-acetylmuramic acid kinase [uncultured Neptuniibacter sp.]